MLALEEARELLLAAVSPLPSETIPLRFAAGRILTAGVASRIALPPFDNSAMDGYALVAADVAKASGDASLQLRCLGETAAGQPPGELVGAGNCWRVFTGSALPAGADAVVMQEDTQPVPDQPEQVAVTDAVRPWENVRFMGEDVKLGAVLGTCGERLEFGRIGLLAAAGISEVSVGRRPRVAILSTGSELVEPGGTLRPGQIFESNRFALEVLVRQSGGEPLLYPLVPDDLESTRRALELAARECDAVITSGGVSVGAHDHVKAAIEALGGQLHFWKVAIRPGKPFVHGEVSGRSFFGLPGNPVSAVVTFLLLVRPALIRMQGGVDLELPVVKGVLATTLRNPGGRRHFVRVRIDGRGAVLLCGSQGSHVMAGLADANGLVDVPPGAEWPESAAVEVMLINR